MRRGATQGSGGARAVAAVQREPRRQPHVLPCKTRRRRVELHKVAEPAVRPASERAEGRAGMLRSAGPPGVPLPPPPHARLSLFDSCHRKIRLIGGGPVAFLGGLVAKARRKEREGEAGAGDPKLYLQEALLERKLPELDMRQLVDLPRGLDLNEWLASHTLALFDHVNLLYGCVSEFCTPAVCPEMAGPGGRSYAWYDERGKKCRLAAPHYVDYVMTYTQKTVNDETVFPTKYANEFPAGFEATVRRVVRLLFHVVAHLYAAHFRSLALLRLHAHLHLTFAHLTALDQRFALLDAKETEVLRDLEVALRLTEPAGGAAGAGGSGAGGAGGADDSPRRSPVVTQPLATA